MDRSLTRCGISEPVMKIARSSTFCFRSEVWLAGGSASSVPASTLATTRVATPENIRVFTREAIPARQLCANCRNDQDGLCLQKQDTQWLLPLPPDRLD